jgi:hypothetical protein
LDRSNVLSLGDRPAETMETVVTVDRDGRPVAPSRGRLRPLGIREVQITGDMESILCASTPRRDSRSETTG